MNILLIPHLFLPRLGGVEIVTANLAQHLVAGGHKVQIVTAKFPKTLPESENINGLNITRLPFRLPSTSIRSLLSFLLNGCYSIKKLLLITKTTDFDLINLHFVSENSLYALLLRYVKRLPLVTNIHGSDIENFSLRNPLNKSLVHLVLKHSDRIISNSRALVKTTCQTFGSQFLNRTIVIGNGINMSSYDQFENPFQNLSPYILGIGRLAPVKGFDTLIKAFSIVVKRFPKVRLALAGDGSERGRLEDLTRDLNLEGSVCFLGRLEHENLPGLLSGSEFLVSPSRKEAFGIVNLEAMAAKKAIIGMDVGGVREIVYHGKNGLLVREHNHEDLANTILFLLEHPKLARQFGLNGRNIVEAKYSWDKIAKRYLDIYGSVLETSG